MVSIPFEELWSRIVAHQGEVFHAIRGLEFTYKLVGSTLYPGRTSYQISKSDLESATKWCQLIGKE